MGGTQGGRYLECDHKGCGNTFSLNLPWSADAQTRAAAMEAGWSIGKVDLCPEHAPPADVAIIDGEEFFRIKGPAW